MKVKNMEQLRQLALSKGVAAKVNDGTLVNGGKNKIANPQRRETPAPIQEPQPAPPPMEDPEAAGDRLGRVVLAAVQMALDSRPAPTVAVDPPRSWEFTIERDKDGLLKKIKATPVMPTMH